MLGALCLRACRFVGGHSPDLATQGRSFFVFCLCPDCSDKELNYIENDGCLLTVEEFCEHATGVDAAKDPDAWRSSIMVLPGANHTKKAHSAPPFPLVLPSSRPPSPSFWSAASIPASGTDSRGMIRCS